MAINRTQALVLGFFVLAWASLVALFAAAPEVYGRALGLSSAEGRLLFLGAITALLALLSIGVIRRWRWVFWLIFVAFLFGPLRVVASVLALVHPQRGLCVMGYSCLHEASNFRSGTVGKGARTTRSRAALQGRLRDAS
ncbi:MAG TPA: hypothetical protein VFY54_04180 [Rubrobacter sp.]|nr:hypothetical protein [Rubrobacter sp.]